MNKLVNIIPKFLSEIPRPSSIFCLALFCPSGSIFLASPGFGNFKPPPHACKKIHKEKVQNILNKIFPNLKSYTFPKHLSYERFSN